MIGKEDNQEEPVLKVTDRRKFNVDGSLREGVIIEKAEEKPSEPETITSDVISTDTEIPSARVGETVGAASAPAIEDEDEIDIMNDENPASFVNFLSTLVTNAAASLGAMPHPVTGQKSVDLDTGKYWIDVLAMLREKTDGNLNMQEKTLLESILGDLRMQYVQLARAAEEKLKAQAARKFSSKDILGG
jgi:hypothetical protein